LIVTRVAKHLFGENLYFGHRTLADLLGRETMTGLLAMAVRGRRPSDDERAALDAIAVVLNSPDPHIWPLKIARLVSSYGGVLPGFAAGQLPIEGERIGPWVVGYAATALAELREAVGDRIDDETVVAREVRALLARRKRVHGFGVPLRPSDERMDALERHAARTGLDGRPHWRLWSALAAEVERTKGLKPNGCSGIAAVLLDLGYTPAQASAFAHFVNHNVWVANVMEAAQQRSPEMQKLGEEHVDYAGPPARSTPRAARSA
jgi:citrate synthase